jgi:hypothetical protein
VIRQSLQRSHGASAGKDPPTEDTKRLMPEDTKMPNDVASPVEDSKGDSTTVVDPLEGVPDELKFLFGPKCNPDLADPKVQKIGCMKNAGDDQELDMANRGTCICIQRIVAYIVFTKLVQGIVLLVILFDLLMTIISFTNSIPEDAEIYSVTDVLILTVLSTDVLLRFVALGCSFLKSWLNVFELILVPISIVEVAFLRDMNLPVPLLRALRPVLRGVRVIRVIVRTAGKGKAYLSVLRKRVSGDRMRYKQNGFDLDLQYIGPQLITMSVPGVGRESILNNPHTEVARFLNERHGNKYLLVNTTEEKRYSLASFFDRYYHFPVAQDSVPTLSSLLHLCKTLDSFLKMDPEHVVAVHSKHGQGRAATVIIALLMYRGEHRTPASGIAYFEHNRVSPETRDTANTQTLDSGSQKRFLEYFAHMCHTDHDHDAEVRKARLTRIQLFGVSNVSSLDICCHVHPGMKLRTGGGIVRNVGSNTPKSGSKISELTESVGTSSVETAADFDIDVEDEEGMENVLLEESSDNILKQMRATIEECEMDSMRAGCQPLKGVPIVSTMPDAGKDAAGRIVDKAEKDDEGPSQGNWEVKDTELGYEVCIEVHRRKNERTGDAEGSDGQPQPGLLARLIQCFLQCCCCMRRDDDNKSKFPGGLLFRCWLHTDFLEQDEPPPDNMNKPRPPNLVTVVMDRFALDKAAFAPAMRSQSATLKLQIEFEVDHRIELRQLQRENSRELNLSSQVNMSDEYSLGWLTWVCERTWPSFQAGFEKMIRDGITNSRDSLPGPLKKLRVAECNFGRSYPRFGPVTASSRHHEGMEVQLDIWVNYVTDTDIRLDLGAINFGICHLKVHGLLSLKFKPILPEIPVFVSMQLLFLNQPEIDLRFTDLLVLANSNFVKNMITSQIDKALFDLMVLPNIMNINWGDPKNESPSAVHFVNVLPTNVLRLSVFAGKGLMCQGSFFKREPDSFVKVSIGSMAAQTQRISKTANPIWDKEFDLLVYDHRQVVSITAYDVDFGNFQRVIGVNNKVTVSDLVRAGPDGMWVPLEDTPVGGKSMIQLRAIMYDLRFDKKKVESFITSGDGVVILEPTPELSPKIKNEDSFSGMFGGCVSTFAGTADNAINEEEPDSMLCSAQQISNVEAGAVVLLVCECIGGLMPASFAKPTEVELRFSFGSKKNSQPCTDSAEVDAGTLSKKQQETIVRLAKKDWTADAIAELLGEDLMEVTRVWRRHGWNLECPQKVSLLVHPSDLANATDVQCQIVKGKIVLARGKIALKSVIAALSQKGHHSVICKLDAASGPAESSATLDIEIRVYALFQSELQSLDAEDGSTKAHGKEKRGNCPSCNGELYSDSLFCRNCGEKCPPPKADKSLSKQGSAVLATTPVKPSAQTPTRPEAKTLAEDTGTPSALENKENPETTRSSASSSVDI